MDEHYYEIDDYEQVEKPNTAKRAALIGAAALMILLGAIAVVLFNLSGPPPAPPLADATASPPPTDTPAPTPTAAALPVPQLVYLGTRNYRTDEGRFTAYQFAIANSADYPAEQFGEDPDHRPCLAFRDAASHAEVGAMCGFQAVSELEVVEFSLRRREPPPAAVYVELLDPGSGQASRSAVVSISVTAAVTPSPPATPLPSPSADGEAWVAPELVSTGRYGDLSLVVDGDGTAHAAIEVGQRIHYLTRASAGWVEERLPTGPIIKRRSLATGYSRPVVALADRGLRIDYVHYELCVGCIGYHEEPFYLTGQAGQWSAPKPVTRAMELGPEWQVQELVDTKGNIHLTHWQSGWDGGDLSDCGLVDSTSVWYTTNASGVWTSEEIAPGASNFLHMGADGRPRVLLLERHWCEDEDADSRAQDMRYATARTATGSFELETVPSTVGLYFTALAVDASGRPHVILQRDEQKPGTYYQVRHNSGWAEPELILSNAYGLASQIDEHGALHLILVRDGALWYATNRTGAFEVETVITSPKARSGNVAAAVSVDGSGRPHILFRLGEGANAELHYAVGPAD